MHPSLLDRAALIAGWRETLLAQKVLAGGTQGYTRHPQLTRFRAHPEPLDAIGAYLVGLREEASARGYRFDPTRILQPADPKALHDSAPLPVTIGQLEFELAHLRRKCEGRSLEWLERLPAAGLVPPAHPLLQVVPGEVEDWEVR